MSGAFLLDVNLLVALFDPDHIHHEAAHEWFADHRGSGWATCSTTEAGFVRVLSHPAYGAAVQRPVDLLARFRQFCTSGDHVFWPESLSLRDEGLFAPAMIRGHRQVTDVYLLGLAVRSGGRLATFDRTIPTAAVLGATPDTLAVVGRVVAEEPTRA